MAEPAASSGRRLFELDALRGIAAVMVMLFHYTRRYEELYGHDTPLPFKLSWGYYGVNLFFCISGFVIFMTLARTKRPADFVVSRFSRLYPAYWVAGLLTFAVTRSLGLPGKEVGAADAVLNVLMFHGLFFIPNVDSVYWTLVVELIFYLWALAFFAAGQLRHVNAALALVLLLRLAAPYLPQVIGVELPWRVSSLLILPYIPWFACGIAMYLLHEARMSRAATPKSDLAGPLGIVLLATLSLVQDGWVPALLAPCLSALLYLAASGRLKILRWNAVVWLGAISYTLYLLHENIGWALIRRLELVGISPFWAVVTAIFVALILAEAVRRWAEQPAMRWIRDLYRRRDTMTAEVRRRLGAALAATLLLFCATPVVAWVLRPAASSPAQQLRLRSSASAAAIDCAVLRARKPLVLLVLGQSNAANHGGIDRSGQSLPKEVFVISNGACYSSADPLPGGTGSGGSIWTRLPEALAQQGIDRPLALLLIAVESTPIRAWTEYGLLEAQVEHELSGLHSLGFEPDLVLWQQGEADAKLGTAEEVYLRRLERLLAGLRRQGAAGPVLLARSTVCYGPPNLPVRSAIERAATELPNAAPGPDLDTLVGEDRLGAEKGGCHFSSSGLTHAAQLWAQSIARSLPKRTAP